MNFLANKLQERQDFILSNSSEDEQKDLLEELLSTGSAMAAAGVQSQSDFKDFFYVSTHVGNIIKEITGSNFNDENLAKISHLVFVNRDEFPINTIANFYSAVKNALDNSELPITKKAYPQGSESNLIRNPYNLSKWVDSMRQIYAYRQRGYGSQKAFNIVTHKWDEMEKKDFDHWMKFYQSNGHLAYKTAQLRPKYYIPGDDSGPIPFDVLRATLPKSYEAMNAEDAKVRHLEEKKHEEKDDVSEKVTKLVGRLNSAEKLFTSVDFKKVLGDEYEEWLECLHKLKRIIYSKQPKTASMVGDLIVRQGNKLKADGFKKASKLMNIIAAWQEQTMYQFDEAIGIPFFKCAQTAPPELGDMGLGDSTDIMGESPGGTSEDGRDLSDPEGAMREFIENIGGEKSEETKEASFEEDDAMIIVAEDGFYRFAQAAPSPISEPKKDIPLPEAGPVKTEDGNAERGDHAIDAALKNIKLPDVIAKLEELVQFYRNRQISRELLIVDLMLEALGISAFFPSMAEASKSSLDSNQYVLTRLEDILAKLRGASAVETGEMETIKDKLQHQSENQDKRKEEKEKADMVPGGPPEMAQEGGPAPIKPAPEKELAQPAAIEQAPQPAPIR